MKSGITRLTLTAIVLVMMLGGCGTDKKEIKLAYKFDTGKKYHFVYNSQTSTTAYENDKLVYSGDSTFRVSYVQEAVEILDDTSARLRFTYTDENRGGISKTWSTEYVMSTNGEITGLAADEEVTEESVEYYKKLLEQAAPMYPEEAVTEGFTWNHTVRILLDEGATDAKTTYKVKSFVREAGYDCAVIEYKGNMVIPLEADCISEKGAAVGHDKIEVEGAAYFAYTEGIVIKEEENSKLVREGTVTIEGQTTDFKIEEERSYTCTLTNIE